MREQRKRYKSVEDLRISQFRHTDQQEVIWLLEGVHRGTHPLATPELVREKYKHHFKNFFVTLEPFSVIANL